MSGFLEAQHGDLNTSGCRELQVAARDGDIAYLVPSPERTTSVYRLEHYLAQASSQNFDGLFTQGGNGLKGRSTS